MKRILALCLVAFLFLVSASVFAADCNSGGRYEVMGDGTVQDCRTGLIWLQDTNCLDSLGLAGIDKSAGSLDWYDALTWVAALSSGNCGLDDGSFAGDWRLPTKTEFMAMVASAKKQGFSSPSLTNAAGTATWTTNGDAFNNVQSDYYWSSTTQATIASNAWLINFVFGVMLVDGKTFSHFVWPVRGGQSGEFGSVIIQ